MTKNPLTPLFRLSLPLLILHSFALFSSLSLSLAFFCSCCFEWMKLVVGERGVFASEGAGGKEREGH